MAIRIPIIPRLMPDCHAPMPPAPQPLIPGNPHLLLLLFTPSPLPPRTPAPLLTIPKSPPFDDSHPGLLPPPGYQKNSPPVTCAISLDFIECLRTTPSLHVMPPFTMTHIAHRILKRSSAEWLISISKGDL